MVNPVWAVVAGLAVIGVIVKVRKKQRLLFRIATPVLAAAFVLGILHFGWMHARYWFDTTISKDGAVILIRHGRMCGPVWEIDVPNEYYAGSILSPWFADLGTSEAGENNDYEGHFTEEYPVRLFWDSADRFWIERYGSGAGIFVRRDPHGQWRVRCVNGGMRDLVRR